MRQTSKIDKLMPHWCWQRLRDGRFNTRLMWQPPRWHLDMRRFEKPAVLWLALTRIPRWWLETVWDMWDNLRHVEIFEMCWDALNLHPAHQKVVYVVQSKYVYNSTAVSEMSKNQVRLSPSGTDLGLFKISFLKSPRNRGQTLDIPVIELPGCPADVY